MLLPRRVVGIAAVGLILLGAGIALGQDYPYKPIRIVTGGGGGSSDFSSRQIALGISGPLGQQVIVDNRPSGVIPGETVAKAAPDGYTLLSTGGILWIGPLLEKTPYDPIRDFSPISLTARSPNVLVVHPSLPVRSVKELIALARARPGELNYGSAGVGGSAHLAAELFNSMASANIVRIPYKGGGAALNGLMGGEVQLAFSGAASSVTPQVKAGRLRALAVTGMRPSTLFPGLPTVASSGLPGYAAESIDAILVPAKTPAPIIARLNQEIVQVLNKADVKERLLNIGVEVASSSPEELAAAIKSEMVKWGKLINAAGIKVE